MPNPAKVIPIKTQATSGLIAEIARLKSYIRAIDPPIEPLTITSRNQVYHEGFIPGMDRVSNILKIIDQDYGPFPEKVEAAAARGTSAHNACLAYAVGLFPVLTDEIEGYFQSFRAWFDEMVAEVKMEPEIELVDQHLGYCGHTDLPWLIMRDGRNALVDLKTPVQNRRIWDIQVGGAYWRLVRLATGLTVIDPACLMLDPDGGTARMVWIKNPEQCFAVFCGILNAKRFLENGGGS